MKISAQKSFFWSVISAIILLILLSACVTQKQRDRILKDCPIGKVTSEKDSSWIEKKQKKDTIIITRVGPIEYLPSPCESICDSLGNLKPFKQVSEKNGIKQTLQSVGNRLVQKCDVDSLQEVIIFQNDIIHKIKTKTETITVPAKCELQHLTDSDIFYRQIGKIAIWIIIAYVILRMCAKRWPFISKFII